MAYIDKDYYINVYGGTESDECERLLERASSVVDRITGYRIRHIGFDKLSEFEREQVMLAAASQADHIEKNGGINSYDSAYAVQMTLGKFSYMNASGVSEKNRHSISEESISALEAAGLLCRRVNVGGG